MSEEHTKELEPCPFCGVALILLGDYDHEKAWNWYGHPDADDSDCLLSQHKIRTKSDLRTPMTTDQKAWNRRASVAAPQGEDDTAYNADAILRLRQEVIGEVERERLAKALPWVRSLVNDLIQRIYNLRRMAAPSTQPSARVAAEELEREGWLLADVTQEERDKVAAIISRHFPSVQPVEEQKDGWVTFGRVKVDIENETETFERIEPE